jgi:2-polyprenyl-6-methoxyphenol hydroxylase-like FAD-dependent oxidoreductase
VPRRLASGRLAIVGNAAHVPTPMTGSGFAASVADASALVRALDGVDTADVPAALEDYEGERLRAARDLVLSGQSFSRNFAIDS